MSIARISTKGQLVIPARLLRALNLQAGDKVEMKLDGRRLIIQPVSAPAAKLKRGRFGRLVLAASKEALPMTTESVNALLEELP